jgi:hypothetical protein
MKIIGGVGTPAKGRTPLRLGGPAAQPGLSGPVKAPESLLHDAVPVIPP